MFFTCFFSVKAFLSDIPNWTGVAIWFVTPDFNGMMFSARTQFLSSMLELFFTTISWGSSISYASAGPSLTSGWCVEVKFICYCGGETLLSAVVCWTGGGRVACAGTVISMFYLKRCWFKSECCMLFGFWMLSDRVQGFEPSETPVVKRSF